ncbi:MAG: hypothetical protein LAT62_06910 [Natronospirillum sp.]|uniref:hypothetical protein n=1 Tax=Natronospirillum sp. TaxID=2812955 RepID=UPI0025FA2763|nr:hypothetical protein [Natronospirillum sp.]MCH8551647.1 hypothetical protein [Natronospirillum sp.]
MPTRPLTCMLLLSTLLVSPAVADDERTWFWHYTPLDGTTHGIGVSRTDNGQAANWLVRANIGYELETLGASLVRQQSLLSDHPDWYLATGVRVVHHFQNTDEGPCSVINCEEPAGEWEGVLFSRWSWGLQRQDFRLDLGYGAQFRVRERGASSAPAWSLSPNVDVTLGWRL